MYNAFHVGSIHKQPFSVYTASVRLIRSWPRAPTTERCESGILFAARKRRFLEVIIHHARLDLMIKQFISSRYFTQSGHGADVKCVDWHPQKGLIISGSKDNQQPVKLWDPKSGQSLATL